MARNDPLRNFRYRLEIDNVAQAGFSEVAIAETTIDAVDYREGNEPPHVRKLSGLTKYGNVTLKWGITAGQIKDRRKKVVIVVQQEDGTDAARFVISDAWPVKYDPSDLNAKGNEVMIEMLELANEGIERVS
jgi:phage tail-like protein